MMNKKIMNVLITAIITCGFTCAHAVEESPSQEPTFWEDGGALALGAFIPAAIFLGVTILRDGFSEGEAAAALAGILFTPVIGSLVCHKIAVAYSTNEHIKQRGFWANGGAGAIGALFTLPLSICAGAGLGKVIDCSEHVVDVCIFAVASAIAPLLAYGAHKAWNRFVSSRESSVGTPSAS